MENTAWHMTLCRFGLHSWFCQEDRWGCADVCRYCEAIGYIHTHGGAW